MQTIAETMTAKEKCHSLTGVVLRLQVQKMLGETIYVQAFKTQKIIQSKCNKSAFISKEAGNQADINSIPLCLIPDD